MYRLVDIPPPGGFFWSQTAGIVPSLRGIFNAAGLAARFRAAPASPVPVPRVP